MLAPSRGEALGDGEQEIFMHQYREYVLMKQSLLIMLVISLMTIQVSGQVYTNKIAGVKNLGLKDSLEKQPYPYAVPFWIVTYMHN